MRGNLWKLGVVALLLAALGATGAPAQTTNYWTNTLGGAWNTADNWVTNAWPSTTTTWVLFTNNATSAYKVDLSGGTVTSGQFRVTSDNIIIDPQGYRWLVNAPADGGVGTLGHWIGREPGSTATVTFSSSVASPNNLVNFNLTDNSTTVIGTNNGLTVINIDASEGNGMRVQMSKNVMIHNPSSAVTNVIVNIDGAGSEWYVAGNNSSGYNGIWNVSNGGKLTEGLYGLSIGGGSSPGVAGYAMMTFSNATFQTAAGTLNYVTYLNQAFAQGHVRLYDDSTWSAKTIYIGRYLGAPSSVLVDDSAIYATAMWVGGNDDMGAQKAVGNLTIQNGGLMVVSNGHFVVNSPATAATSNRFVLDNATVKLGGTITNVNYNGAMTNRSLVRASGTMIGIGQSRGLVRNEKYLEVGASLGTLTLSNLNLELAAGSQTFFEFSDTGLDQLIINGGSASLDGSNLFSLAAGSATPAPGMKWGLGTYDFIIASNITWNVQYDNLTNTVLAGLVHGLDYTYGIVDIGGGFQALRLEFVPEPSTMLLLLGGGLVLYRVRRRVRGRSVLGLILALALGAGSGSAEVLIDQADFSVGYGFSGGWTTNETAAANTPATAPNPNGTSFTVGDFKYTVTVTAGGLYGSVGPFFPNRVLTNGDGTGQNGQASNLTVSVNAVYTGTYPPGGGYKEPSFSLAIDQISIYGFGYGNTNPVWWTETTADHTGVSPSFNLKTGAASVAADYTKITWNPDDWVIDGTNITRTFRLPNGLDAGYFGFAVDGLEIIGHTQLTAFVPEPSTVVLIAMGGLALAWWRRRN